MKMNKYILLFIVFISITISACKKEYEDIGLPASKIEGVTSKWIVSKFLVTDKGGILEESLDMTDFYTSDPVKNALPTITFSISGTDTLFSCDTANLALNIFEVPGGRWRFDDNNFPTKIILMKDDKSLLSEFSLLAPIRPIDQNLKISKSTVCTNGKTIYTYDLVMNRITN
jgi:Domain of unknown function (DUF5004)